MNSKPTAVLASFALASLASQAQDQPKVTWELTDGVKAPESAYYHHVTGLVFLSQIGGGGGKAVDGDGYISKLSLDGKMVMEKWATGLNAPKGIRVFGDTLWVSDITRLVGFDLKTGKIRAEHEIAGAHFLNDVAAADDGTIYVSDMPASTIYQLVDGKVSVFAKGPELESPNGLLVDGPRLLLGGWGREIDPANFNVKTPGRLLSIDRKTKKITVITRKPTGNLDGVELDGKGGYIVTDWKAGKLFHIKGDGTTTVITTLPRGTADHAYLPDQKLLILPRMLENMVTAYDLSGIAP